MKSATRWKRAAARYEPCLDQPGRPNFHADRMTLFLPLNHAWNFRRLPAAGGAAGAWTEVGLPHSPFVADLDGREHWFGECEYQRAVQLPADAPAGRCALSIGAAMHSAVVLVDNAEIARHAGGYLPFEVDLTAALR